METVSFDGDGLRLDTAEDAETICKELEGKAVERLILQGNTFGIEAAERIGLELAQQPHLKEAHFKDLFTSRSREEVPVAMRHLLQGIHHSGAQLTLLDLSDNAIGPIGAPSVIEFLNSPSAVSIEKLYINNCGWGPEGSSSIAPSISKLTKIRELICGRSRLEDKGATNMSRAISELPYLEVLKLNQNGIRVEGIKAIAQALEGSREISELDLSDNTVKDEGANHLSQVIASSKNLKELRLDDCLLCNDGFSIICDAISKSPSRFNLTTASFEGNELAGHKIVDLVSLTFGHCRSEFTLDLLENEFSADELARLEHIGQKFEILVDEIESDDSGGDDGGEDRSYDDGKQVYDEDEEADEEEEDADTEVIDNDNEIRDIVAEFVECTSARPLNNALINNTFHQLLLASEGYHSIQIICEELGLMKSETTRKKKQLAKDAILYIGKRSQELPKPFKDFFRSVVENDDEFDCGKLLFQELNI